MSGDPSNGVPELKMLLESEEGEFLPRFEFWMVVVGNETNSLPLVPYVKGMHSMDLVLVVVQPLFPMDVFLQSRMDKGSLYRVLIKIGELHLPRVVFDALNLQNGTVYEVHPIPLCALPPCHTSSCALLD